MMDYFVMFGIMFLSGILSSMNVWVDKYEDIRLGLNDVYMALLMTGWMFFFMGLYYQDSPVGLSGLSLVLLMVWCIRKQLFIDMQQYNLGMIPHHSMAVYMSKKLLATKPPNEQYLLNIIHNQEKEIEYMKSL
jgi:hypothetical protein